MIDSNGIELHGASIEDVPPQIIAFSRWLQEYAHDMGLDEDPEGYTAAHDTEIKSQARAHGLDMLDDGTLQIIRS